MANKRYGLKEVADVIFFDIATGKPALFFDTLKISTIENESESAEARGGQGNKKLMAWDFGRTATLTMQDALLSDASLAMLAGTEVKTTDIKAVGRETLTLVTDTGGVKVTLAETPIANSVSVWKMVGGIMTEELTGHTITAKDVKFATAPVGHGAGSQIAVFYEYEAGAEATMVTFAGSKFPSTYKVVGTTVVRGEDGIDRKMQFHIAKAKLLSSFSLTMDVENVSTFDFNLDILVDTSTDKLYDIIRL